MKKVMIGSFRAAVYYGILAAAGLARIHAQDAVQSTTTTSTTSAGTVSEFTPGFITVRSGPSALPVSYSYTKTTTYVDENGNPISSETVKSGAPVTVYYTQSGDQMVASKVIVRHIVPTDGSTIIKKTTTTTTTTPAP